MDYAALDAEVLVTLHGKIMDPSVPQLLLEPDECNGFAKQSVSVAN